MWTQEWKLNTVWIGGEEKRIRSGNSMNKGSRYTVFLRKRLALAVAPQLALFLVVYVYLCPIDYDHLQERALFIFV